MLSLVLSKNVEGLGLGYFVDPGFIWRAFGFIEEGNGFSYPSCVVS